MLRRLEENISVAKIREQNVSFPFQMPFKLTDTLSLAIMCSPE